MMEQDIKPHSLKELFASSQETFEEAKKKSSEESSKKATFFRISKDGTYTVRILPLAPVVDAEGNFLPLERKGYEYPLRSLLLKIEDTTKKSAGKPQTSFVTVPNAKYAFKNLESDLIDAYVRVACEKYADDEKLVKKLREGSFSGGLKWDSKRCMYIIDLDNPGEGFQILQLSYSQYKDLEERKLNLWAKLNKNGKSAPCPISSIDGAYPVEIIRATEGGKAKYSFNIDTVSDKEVLDDETLQKLLDTPRLPENIYRYTRYHLEASIVFLTQLDEKFNIEVMSDPAIQDAIEAVKMCLPADDTSHFVLGGKKGDDAEGSADTTNSLDALWARFDKLEDSGLDDATAEGQELRTSIKEFIEDNELDIKITRKKSNSDLLNEIEDTLEEGKEDEEEEAPKTKPAPVEEEPDDELDDEPASPADDDEEEDDEPAEPSRRRERNDDTNEPAVRASRRGERPHRRR